MFITITMDFTHFWNFWCSLFFLMHFCTCDENVTKIGTVYFREEGQMFVSTYFHTSSTFMDRNFDEDIHNHCKSKMTSFANSSSDYIHCAIINARPVRMCQSCARKYLKAVRAYTNITSDVHGEDACNLYLLNADRIQIIKFTYNQIRSMWENSNCNNCFKNNLTLADDTVKIEQLVNQTFDCIVSTNKSVCSKDDKNGSHCYNLACKNCSVVYQNLNTFYETLVVKYGMLKLCMDIVDQVNNTRKVWSKELSCVHFDNDTVVLFTLVAFFGICPIVFYLGIWIQSDEQKSKIIPQKRLATSRSAVQISIN